MPHELNQVVTFAQDARRGNPVYVLLADTVPDAATAVGICGLLGTGYLVVLVDALSDEPTLASFTPQGVHPGSGHGSLAAAWLVFERFGRGRREIEFALPGGGHRVARRTRQGRVGIDWPHMPFETVDLNQALGNALGKSVTGSFSAPFGLVALLDDEAAVTALKPNLSQVAAFGTPSVIAAAKGSSSDIVVRVFAPNVGLPEDPVCGTAHRILAPMFGAKLATGAIHSRHLSARGGDLYCDVTSDTVTISGDAVLALHGELHFPGLAPAIAETRQAANDAARGAR